MSESGIIPINSGPLLLRAYLGSSPNNTYLLGPFDVPFSTNRVLITSTNGLLAPSDSIFPLSHYFDVFLSHQNNAHHYREMASADFNYVTLRNVTPSNTDGSYIRTGYVFTVGPDAKQMLVVQLDFINAAVRSTNINCQVLSTKRISRHCSNRHRIK